jgi:uncharacterized membrane protein YphA (DoxX/SURF4 family)
MCPAIFKHKDLGRLVLRLGVAAVFIVYGSNKWGLWSNPGEMTGGMLALMKALSIIEPLAGVLMVIGLFTRYAALAFAIIMVGAMYMKLSGGQPFTAWSLDLVLFCASVAIMTNGAGSMSMDAKRN